METSMSTETDWTQAAGQFQQKFQQTLGETWTKAL